MSPALLLAALVATQVPDPLAPSAVVWQAPPGCPDRAALEQAIAGRLGRAPAAGDFELDGAVARIADGRYRLNLRVAVGGHAQTRTLTARRCPALADAAALLVAAALDPRRSPAANDGAPEVEDSDATDEATAMDSPTEGQDLRDDSPPREPDITAPDPSLPPDPPPAAVVELAAPEPPPPPPRRLGPGGFVRLAGGLEYGALPGLTGGLNLAGGVLWKRARLELHGVYLPAQTATRGGNSLDVDLFAGGAQGCARLGRRRLEVPLCGGLEFGAVRGRHARGPGARDATSRWLAGLVSAAIAWHVHPRLAASLTAQGVVRVAAPEFVLQDPGPPVRLHLPAPVSLRVLLGLELRLGDPW